MLAHEFLIQSSKYFLVVRRGLLPILDELFNVLQAVLLVQPLSADPDPCFQFYMDPHPDTTVIK
jgi:hypothetical protein